MYNELFTIGPFTVHTYGVMIAIGILAAYFMAEKTAKKHGLNPEMILDLVLWCLIFGFAGSKILYTITIWPQVIKDPGIIIRSFGDGWVVYGGILGGAVGAYLYCRKKKLDVWKYFDLALPSVALAQGFGRIGCFFAGCCYGEETNLPIGITFHHSDFAPNGVPLLPTQVLSSAFDFLLFCFLVWFYRRKKADGQITALYLICYSVGRFIIEFFRGDLGRGSVGALSTSQFISIFMFAAGVILFVIRAKAAPSSEKGTAQEGLQAEDEEEQKIE